MASLDLVPNMVVTPIQMLVFLTNTYVVKKLILDPYLDLKKKRLNRTVSATANALSSIQLAEEKEKQIELRLQQAQREAAEEYKKVREEATSRQQELLKQATDKSGKAYDQALKEIEQNLAEAVKQVPTVVEPLVQQMYQKVIQVS